MEPVTFTVGQLTHQIKEALETGFSDVWVVGEIVGYKRHSSGHLYFTLKDNDARLSAIVFRGQTRFLALPVDRVEDGLKVLCHGRLDLYEPQGAYKIIVDQMRLEGVGGLLQQLEALKKKLALEGLFEASRKKPLPLLPECIGIVTSPTSAAIQDMLTTLQRRFPISIKIYPALVQGDGAVEDICRGIARLDADPEVTLLIVGRGGGAFEDLLPFSDERVVRAVAACRKPIVSAVGHETDFPICDLAADVRAATPTAAATLVVPRKEDLEATLEHHSDRLDVAFERLLERKELRLADWIGQLESRGENRMLLAANTLSRWESRLAQQHPRVILEKAVQRAHGLDQRLKETGDRSLERLTDRLSSLGSRLDALGPRQALGRGFAIVLRKGQPGVVTSAENMAPGDELEVVLHKGRLDTLVQTVHPSKSETVT